MPQIQLDKATPGIRGAQAVSVGEPEVENGLAGLAGGLLKRVPELYVGTDLHTRMEKLADTLEDNEALEAELAFDRWNAQALYGTKDNQTATAYADFEKGKDPTVRAMQLNGLMNARGMAAMDGGKMYDAASQAIVSEMFGKLTPAARARVSARIRAKREATLQALNRRGLAQGEAAQAARQKELLIQRAANQGEAAARDVSAVEAEYAEAVRRANADYATAMASILPEHVVQGQAAKDGTAEPDYAAYRKDYEETAAANRDGAIAAARAKLMGGYAGTGAAYARNRAETDALTRASIVRELGLTEEQAASEEWAPMIEGRIAAAQQDAGASFLDSMLANGHTDFVEAAIADPAALAAEYGIRDRRIVEGFQLKIARMKDAGAKTEKNNDDSVRYWIATCNTLNPETGNYAIPDDELLRVEKLLVERGDFANATSVRNQINRRQQEYMDEQRAANGKLTEDVTFTPEDCTSILRYIQANPGIQRVEVRTGVDKDGKAEYASLSRNTMIRFLVDNYLGIEDQRRREEVYQRYSSGGATEREVGRVVYDVLATSGHVGISYQGYVVDDDGNQTLEGPFLRLDGGVADRGNYRVLPDGRVETMPDAIVNGELLTRNGPQTHAVMTDTEWADATNLVWEAAYNHRLLFPDETQTQFRRFVLDVAGRVFGGSSLQDGYTQRERNNAWMEMVDRQRQQASLFDALVADTIDGLGVDAFRPTRDESGKTREPAIRMPNIVLTNGENQEEDKQ